MPNQRLVDYIKRHLERGVSGERIREQLMNSGISRDQIDDAFSAIGNMKYKENPEEIGKPANLGFAFGLIAALIGFIEIILTLISKSNLFMYDTFALLIAVGVPLFLDIMILLNALKLRKDDRMKRFSKIMLVYAVVFILFGILMNNAYTFVLNVEIIIGILALISGILGLKGK